MGTTKGHKMPHKTAHIHVGEPSATISVRCTHHTLLAIRISALARVFDPHAEELSHTVFWQIIINGWLAEYCNSLMRVPGSSLTTAIDRVDYSEIDSTLKFGNMHVWSRQ